MPCQYNHPTSFDPKKVVAFDRILRVRGKLAKAKEKLEKKDFKGRHPWDTAIEIQRYNQELSGLMETLRPVRVK